LAQIILGRIDSKFVQIKGIAPLQGEVIAKESKYTKKNFKIFFSRTSRPKLIKLGTNYLWVKEIQVCSNKGPGSLQRGDNHKNIKMGLGHLKIFFRTMKPEKLNFT
jgi:hypothetical protein